MTPSDRTSVEHSFGLEIDGVIIKQISEISGLTMEQEVLEFLTAEEPSSPARKLPGRPKGGEVTLTRGLTVDSSFETWMKDVRSGSGPFKATRSVIVFDGTGAVLKSYRLVNAWPKKLEIGTMARGDATELVEKLTVTYEEMAPE